MAVGMDSLDCPQCGHKLEVPDADTSEKDHLIMHCINPRCETVLELDRVCYWSASVYEDD